MKNHSHNGPQLQVASAMNIQEEELQRLLSFLLGDRSLTPTCKHREVAVLETNELLPKKHVWLIGQLRRVSHETCNMGQKGTF